MIIPAHNEEGNLQLTVGALIAGLAGVEFEREVIIVDDCSTDGTGALADRLAAENGIVRVVHRTGSPGFGLALRWGFRFATGDYVAPFMGDGSDSPMDLIRLVRWAEEGGCDIVLGARWIKGGGAVGYPPLKMIFSRGFSFACRVLLGVPAHDCSNAFRVYRRRVVQELDLSSSGFEITAEAVVKAYRAGFSIVELPVFWRQRIRGSSKLKYLRAGPGFLSLLLRYVRTRQSGCHAKSGEQPSWG